MEKQVHTFQLNLPAMLYNLLQARAEELQKTDQEVLELAVQSWLIPDTAGELARIEKRLEALVDRRVAALRSEFFSVSENRPLPPTQPIPPLHPVHQLQVGDVVQVRESGSLYYLEQLPVTRVGFIRAYVQTREGERSFLKRDLRFIHASHDRA